MLKAGWFMPRVKPASNRAAYLAGQIIAAERKTCRPAVATPVARSPVDLRYAAIVEGD